MTSGEFFEGVLLSGFFGWIFGGIQSLIERDPAMLPRAFKVAKEFVGLSVVIGLVMMFIENILLK